MSRIIIGDCHGCYKTLLKLIETLPKDVPITFVGDLIDRGNNSKDVVQYVIDNKHDCVMGNHEDLMIRANEQGGRFSEIREASVIWHSNGGLRALQSYKGAEEKLLEHCEWMAKLPKYLVYDDCVDAQGRKLLVSHAGINYLYGDLDETLQAAVKYDEIMWHRDPIVDIPGYYQILGHTPIPDGVDVQPHYANVDTGAVFKRDFSELYGVLTAIQFPEMIIYQIGNCE